MNIEFLGPATRGCNKCWALAAACALALTGPRGAGAAAINITQHHNNPSRDGLYIDPAFTKAAAANLKRDLSFNGAIVGNVYAQPLYLDSGPNGNAAVIVVTESNNIYALDAFSGNVIWQTNAGPCVPMSLLPCGDINPVGIVGTPVVDLPSRSLFFDALINPPTGGPKHRIYSLNLDSGTLNSGWPVNVDASASFGGTAFTSLTQGQRSALAVIGGILYVAYGGNAGDCSTYYGWLVGVPLDNPSNVMAWATSASGGGSWAVGGVSSDGTNAFIATGNTFGASVWSGGEAIIRFQPGPVFSQQTSDFWAPGNWQSLDSGDLDIGSSGALLVDVPGATPSSLILACGKDGNAYLLNRANLGGISAPIAKTTVSTSTLIQAPSTYRTVQGTYVSVCFGTQVTALHITATNPPTMRSAWTASVGGRCSSFVTSTDGTNNTIVWGLGCEGDQRLHGLDGDTGATVFAGGGANELMANTHRFSTAVAAHGRIYVATDNKVYAFALPASPVVLTNPTVLPENVFQFGFNNVAGLSFTVLGTTNISIPFANWTRLGAAQEISPGQFQFSSPLSTTGCPWFFSVRSP